MMTFKFNNHKATIKTSVSAMLLMVSGLAPFSASACSNIGISRVQDLSFGTFSATTSGDIIVSTAGERTATGGVVLVGGTVSEAQFQITGTAECTYSISLPTSTTIINTNTSHISTTVTNTSTPITSGDQSMIITIYTKNPTAGTLDVAGNETLHVGATLSASKRQLEGAYSGVFTVTVNYN